MKILYVVDYYQPQLGYSEYFIPHQLVKKGHQVKILTSNYYFPFPNYAESAGRILGERQQLAGRFVLDGIEVIKEPMVAEFFCRAIFFHHQEVLQEFQPDLVIVNKSAGFNTIRMAQLKQKYGYTLISYDAHLPSGFLAVGNYHIKVLFYWLFRFFFAGLLNAQVDQFVAVQEDTKLIMEKYYGQKNIVHIPLGTDTDRFWRDEAAGKRVRKQLKIGAKDFVVIYTGKIIQTKGVHLLFAALNRLWKKDHRIQLILVGSGNDEYLQYCFGQISKKYLPFVHGVNFQENKNLYKYYSAANVGVWPLEESTAMNDAAACELPFIANDHIGARVRLSSNNALLYKQGDVADLARQIETLSAHPTKAAQMGKRGKQLIDSKLSWDKIVDQYLAYAN